MKSRQIKSDDDIVIVNDYQPVHEASKSKNKKPKKSRKALVITICSIAGVLILAGLAVWLMMPKTSEKILGADDEDAASPDLIYYSRLTGLEVKDKASETQATTCIMIENSPDARPQSGLKDAGVIYEAIAEGGITRFMAIYQEAKPQFIGPVRSVRLYYAQWAKPYNCSIAHAGGATDALALIRNSANGYRDIDEFYNSSSYWRQSGRYAPHNLYTSFDRLDALNKSKGYSVSEYTGFARTDPDSATAIPDNATKKVSIKMSSNLYNPVYTYDTDTNTYKRAHQSGGVHNDRAQNGTLTQYSPNVVIAIKVHAENRTGTAYANYTTTGTGTAYIFQNGTVIEGKWTRASVDSELTFQDANGNTVLLNRGQVWISAIPNSTGSVSWE